MSLYNSFDRTKHFEELNSNLQTAEGNLTPAVRKGRAQANLGVAMTTGLLMQKQVTPATATGSETLTAAKVLTGLINGTPAGAAAYTLPTGSALETALLAVYPQLDNDDAFDFTVQNLSVTDGQDITVTTNTGWTLVGRMIVEANNVSTIGFATAVVFRARRTAANTYTLYRVSG